MKKEFNKEKFYERAIKVASGCWEWKAATDKQRGRFYYEGKTIQAHRVSYLVSVGNIPDGLWVLHKCDNGKCVNPEHLFLGTHLDNVRDMCQKGRHRNTKKTHCPKGHAYSEENTIIDKKNRRVCRTCRDISNAGYSPAYYEKTRKLLTKKFNGIVKTHCRHGHEYTTENTYFNSKGKRWCKACNRIKIAERRRKYGREPKKTTFVVQAETV